MNESLWTFVFEVANFVAFAMLLGWLFFKPVRKVIDEQQALVRRQEEDAARKVAEAEQIHGEVEAQRRALTTELQAMRTEAEEAAQQEAGQIVAEARAAVERERASLKREALNIHRAQTANIARAVAVATNHTIRQFLQQMTGIELEQALVNAACRELQEFTDDSLPPVTVESAAALDEQSQQSIREALGASAGSTQFRVVPELLGGLRISTARGLIDASITGLAGFAERSFSAEMESMIREESEGD